MIELLVVLVIISLVSAFVAPRITAPIGSLQLKTASKKIAGAMRYSRSLAVSQRESRVCFFDFENQAMSIFPVAAIDSAEQEEVLANGEAEIRYKLPEGVYLAKAIFGDLDINSGLFEVVFFANGSSTGGEIVLANDRGRSFRIQIDFITGMVTLTEPEHVG